MRLKILFITVVLGIVPAAMLAGCAGSARPTQPGMTLHAPKDQDLRDWKPETASPNHLILARDLVAQGHYTVAMRQLTDALKENDKDSEAYYLLGVCYRETGDLETARSSFQTSIKLDSGYSPAYNGLGIAFFLMDDLEPAHAALEKAIALNPANPDYHNNLGVVEMRRNHLDAAEKRFEQCVYLDTGHGRCINNLAECLVRMERDNGAVALLLSHLSPATAYNNLGGVYMILGRRETARKMFLKALDLSPHLPAAMHNLNLMDEGEDAQP